jgi:hypothetical protein
LTAIASLINRAMHPRNSLNGLAIEGFTQLSGDVERALRLLICGWSALKIVRRTKRPMSVRRAGETGLREIL